MTLKDFVLLLYLYPGRWLAWLPPPLLAMIRRAAEPLIRAVSSRHIETLVKSFSIAFGADMPATNAHVVARKFLSASAQRALDDLVLARHTRFTCRTISGREHLDDTLAAGCGVLLVGLHWQSGRIAMRYLRDAGYSVLSVRNAEPEPVGAGAFGRRFLASRYQTFLEGLQGEVAYIQDPSCSLELLAQLRKGGIVVILIDAPASQHTIVSPFLNGMRTFPLGPFYLARAARCAILPWFARGGLQSLEIEFGHPLPLDQRLPFDEFARMHLPLLLGALEANVRKHPEEWELWLQI